MVQPRVMAMPRRLGSTSVAVVIPRARQRPRGTTNSRIRTSHSWVGQEEDVSTAISGGEGHSARRGDTV